LQDILPAKGKMSLLFPFNKKFFYLLLRQRKSLPHNGEVILPCFSFFGLCCRPLFFVFCKVSWSPFAGSGNTISPFICRGLIIPISSCRERKGRLFLSFSPFGNFINSPFSFSVLSAIYEVFAPSFPADQLGGSGPPPFSWPGLFSSSTEYRAYPSYFVMVRLVCLVAATFLFFSPQEDRDFPPTGH